MSQVSMAAAVARIAHEGQFYGGQSYFHGHVEVVANNVSNNPQATYGMVAVAFLHDIIEDTHVTIQDLRDLNFDGLIIAAVDCLTKRPADVESYAEYITRVINHGKMASMVKMADLQLNTLMCERTIMQHESMDSRLRDAVMEHQYKKAKSLLKRYTSATNAIRRTLTKKELAGYGMTPFPVQVADAS